MLKAIQDRQRAWITLQVLQFDYPKRREPIVMNVTVQNNGETPAFIHDFKIQMWVKERLS